MILTEPRLATLRLLRQRILARTRRELDLPNHAPPGIEFAGGGSSDATVFVGRLLSDQNLLAGSRRAAWEPARVALALENGMTDGLSETLEVLHEVGELDADAWQLVCGVLEEFERKVCAAERTDS